jgi:FixJ family two-component response regulator
MDSGRHSILYANGDLKRADMVEAALGRAGASVVRLARADECLRYIRSGGCQLLVSSVPEPAVEGLELLARVKCVAPWVPVIILVEPGRIGTAVRAMKAGATDCIERPPQTDLLLSAVDQALQEVIKRAPSRPLTEVEKTVLQLVLQGKTNGEISAALHRSRRTVEVHRATLMKKLRARHIVDLVRNATLAGLVET